MNPQQVRALIVEIIADVAPEVDLSDASGDEHLQDHYGLDSMDALTILEKIAEETDVDIPETDYDQVESLNGLTNYVAQRA